MMFEYLNYFKKKREAEELIVQAEVLGYQTGINSFEILQNFEGDNFFIKRILNRYRGTSAQRSAIYKGLFDNTFLQMLDSAERKGILIGDVFKDYVEVREKINLGKRKLRTSLAYPFISYFLASVIVFYMLLKLKEQFSMIPQVAGKLFMLSLLITYFWPIVLVFGFCVLIPLIKFPHRVPVLKSAYKEIKGFQYLGMMYIMLRSGLSMTDVVEALREQAMKEAKLKVVTVENFMERFMGLYLSKVELSVLILSLKMMQYERVIESLLREKKERFIAQMERLSAFIGNFSIFMTLVPIILMLIAMFNLYSVLAGSLGGPGVVR